MLLSMQSVSQPRLIEPGQVDLSLQRILNSKAFRRAPRLRSLLTYTVSNAQAGRSSGERQIASEFLGKGDDYHQILDPAVRVLIGRLRKALARYYREEGVKEDLQCEIPRGSYTPVFTPAGVERGAGASRARSKQDDSSNHAPFNHEGGSVAVLPFTNLTNDPDQNAFCHGLTEEIVTSLAKKPEVDVIVSSSGFQYKDEPVDVREVGRELGVPLVLEGSVRKEGNHTRVTAQLARVEDGVAIWSETIDTTIKGTLNTQRLIAQKVVAGLPITN